MHRWVSVALIATIVATGCETGTRRVAPQAPGQKAALVSAATRPAMRRVRGVMPALGVVNATTINVEARVDGKLASIVDGKPIKAGQLIATSESHRSRAPSNHISGPLPADQKLRPGAAITADRAAVAKARRLVIYTQIRAPTSGLIGLRKVAPGNFVHAGETLLTIAQLRPIGVVFSAPEHYLPRVRAFLNRGPSRWSRRSM